MLYYTLQKWPAGHSRAQLVFAELTGLIGAITLALFSIILNSMISMLTCKAFGS